jgi:hypothetical protein
VPPFARAILDSSSAASGVLVEIIPREPDFKRDSADAQIAREVCGIGHVFQFLAGVNLPGPSLGSFRDFLSGAGVMVDRAFEQSLRLILRGHVVELFRFVLGDAARRCGDGRALQLEQNHRSRSAQALAG